MTPLLLLQCHVAPGLGAKGTENKCVLMAFLMKLGVEAYIAFSSSFCARPTFPWLNTSNSVLSGPGEMWGRVKPDSQLGHGEGVGREKNEEKPMEGGCHTRPQACCWGEERLVSLRSCSDDILRSSEVYKDEDVMRQKAVLSIFHFSVITES